MKPAFPNQTLLPGVIFLLATVSALSGCTPAVYLMPTPIVLHSEKIAAYQDRQPDAGGNIVNIFYATNRLPIGLKDDRLYTTGLSKTLRLGRASIRIGEKGGSWDLLKAFSSTTERDRKLKLTLEKSNELGKLDSADADASGEAAAFIAAINKALADNLSKDITVYVHGATADFYTATAQAAQIRHFTGYDHVVLAFAWPTAENFLYYSTDVENARKTAPAFARLVKFLALNTAVEKINVLAYSAGGQVASPGLALLGKYLAGLETGTARKILKLGEVYFAAPDVDMHTYVAQLPFYIHLVNSTTIAMNPNDFVLNIASIHQGTPRIGRPDATMLTDREIHWLTEASNAGKLNVIRILPEIFSGDDTGAHDFWYSHPWVSTDVFIQLLFHAPPGKRGLTAEYTEGFRWWYFPADYPEKIPGILQELIHETETRQ